MHTLHGTAVVTGSSAGIGALYAAELARRGHELILVARRRDRLEEVARSLRAASGRLVETLVLDFADPDDLRRLEKRLREDERIGILVNNAGSGEYGPFADSDIARIETMLALNVVALTRLTRAVMPRMIARSSGTIVNVGSIQAFLVRANNAAYGASKAYVLNFTESLQQEIDAAGLGDRILVQALLPGATATDFWETAGIRLSSLPASVVMTGPGFVGAAMRGLDLGERVCIPGMPDVSHLEAYAKARVQLGKSAMTDRSAARYGVEAEFA